MSSQSPETVATPAPATGQQVKSKKGLGKVLSRVKTVFRPSKRTSTQLPAEPTIAPTAVEPPPASSEQPLQETQEPAQQAPSKKSSSYDHATRVARMQIHEERARKLGTRFGLEIKPSEFHSTDGDVLRVEKSVRMRIHRNCHECNATFGNTNICPKCEHKRCKQCTRYPIKRNEAEQDANRLRRDALIKKHKEEAPILPSYDYPYNRKALTVKLPSRTGGQDLVYKKVQQRVRRKCHECDSLIRSGGADPRTCTNCGHRRCDDCPRYPAERKKYPYGYPNDMPGQVFKGVHRCHECRKRFPKNAEDGTDCENCSHKKCSSCPRVRPKKVDPEPDKEELDMLQRRMALLSTGDS